MPKKTKAPKCSQAASQANPLAENRESGNIPRDKSVQEQSSSDHEIRRSIGEFSSETTPLGAVETWSPGLKMEVGSLLENRQDSETLHELVDRAPFGMYIVDSKFRIALMNASSQNRAFRNIRPLIGRDFTEVVGILWPEPVAAEILWAFKRTLETGEPYYSRDFFAERSDIEKKEAYEWELQRIALPEGEFGVICYYFDSTRLRTAQEAAVRSEQRFRALVTASSDVIYSIKPDWSEMRRLDGKDGLVENVSLGKDWLEKYVYADDQAMVKVAIEEAVRNKTPFKLEHRVQWPDGNVGWMHSHAVPSLGENGEITEWFGAATDVTARRASELANGRLAAIVESSDDAILSKGLDGTITSWNEAAERLFGYEAAEAIGQSILLIVPPERREEEQAILAKVGRGERIEHFETERLRKDGSRIELSYSISPLKDLAGRVVGASTIARDLSQHRQTQRILFENDRRLRRTEKLAAAGQLAASLAHEINNPLSSVTNALYLLNTDTSLNEESRRLVGMAESELARVTRIVKQSLSYYRVGTVPKPVDLPAILENSLHIFEEKLLRAGVTIRKKIAPGAMVLGFPDEIRQVIDNLLLNAVEAMGHGGRLAISVQPSMHWKKGEKGVRLTIADSGCGIPQHSLAQVFEPFFTTKDEKGTGLGLWVVHGIVAKHEGRIRIRSTEKSGRHGTAVSILWPVGGKSQVAQWNESAA